jgi:hypothetical protein
LPLARVEANGAGVRARIELGDVVLDGLPLPCAALSLDRDGVDAATRRVPAPAPAWSPRAGRLIVHARPGAGAALTLELARPGRVLLERRRTSGRFVEVAWHEVAGVRVEGWVDEEEIEPGSLSDDVGGSIGTIAPSAAGDAREVRRGHYRGPATFAGSVDVEVLAAPSGPAWAALTAARGVVVDWSPDERWASVVAAPGIGPLAGHAFVDRDAIRLPLAPGAWRPTGAPLENRIGHTATPLPGGRVLVAGGWAFAPHHPERRTVRATAEIYDPRAERFFPTAPLLAARAGHTATSLGDGLRGIRVLVCGGERDPSGGGDDEVALSAAEIFDGTRFVPTGPLNDARTGHTATLLPDGSVLVAGGDDGHGHSLATLERWDPATGRFERVGSLGTRRYDHSATLLDGGEVLFAGGRHKNYALQDWWSTFNLDTVERFRPVEGGFADAAPLPAGASRHSATRLRDGRVLVVGGTREGLLDYAPLARSALLYAPALDTWTPLAATTPPAALEARGEHTATLLPDGRVLLVAGASALLLDVGAARFDAAHPPGFARDGHTATLLDDGRVLVIGGEPPDDDGAAAWMPGAELFLPGSAR